MASERPAWWYEGVCPKHGGRFMVSQECLACAAAILEARADAAEKKIRSWQRAAHAAGERADAAEKRVADLEAQLAARDAALGEARGLLAEARAALADAAYNTSTSIPVAMGNDDGAIASFYRGQLSRAIGICARALATTEEPSDVFVVGTAIGQRHPIAVGMPYCGVVVSGRDGGLSMCIRDDEHDHTEEPSDG